MAEFKEVIEALEELCTETEERVQSFFGFDKEHHKDVLRGLRKAVSDIKDLQSASKRKKEDCECLDRKRATAWRYTNDAVEHLERAMIVDSSGGQALALAKLAREELSEPC